jgi:Flp pilus assembly pilin Flp
MWHFRAWKARPQSAWAEQGQALVEYTILLALVSLVAIAALTLVGNSFQGMVDQTNETLVSVVTGHGHCGHKACK